MQTLTVTPIITVHSDYETHPNDFDCYTPSQVNAFDRFEWRFVGIVISAEVIAEGTSVTIEAGSLWGIDYGCPATDENDNAQPDYDHDAYLRECAADLWLDVPDVIQSTFPADFANARIVFA